MRSQKQEKKNWSTYFKKSISQIKSQIISAATLHFPNVLHSHRHTHTHGRIHSLHRSLSYQKSLAPTPTVAAFNTMVFLHIVILQSCNEFNLHTSLHFRFSLSSILSLLYISAMHTRSWVQVPHSYTTATTQKAKKSDEKRRKNL